MSHSVEQGGAVLNATEKFEYCPALEDLVQSRQATGRSGRKFTELAALSSNNNLVTLRSLMNSLKPERTLEVGLSFGGSCLVFAASHRDLGQPPAAQHIALDPFQAGVWDDCGLMALERAGLSGYLDFRPQFSSLELPKLLADGTRFGLIYIDGSHLFEDVFIDVYYSIRLLTDGGIVALDDSTNPHVRKVVQFLRTSCRGGLEEIDLTEHRGEHGLSSLRYRSAKALGKLQMTAFRRIGAVERRWDAEFLNF